MEDYYLVEAKQEYTGYLVSTLTPSMYNGFRDIFEQSKKILNGNSVFKNFQILLSNVPNWNSYMLDKEVSDITKETGCDWLDNLITAVFVSHSKILTSVKVGNYRPRNKKIDLKIPDTASFIHQCYVQAAREFYKNPMLFLDDTTIFRPDEILKNGSIAQSIIKDSILSTIRKLLPFRSILNEYLTLDSGNNTIMIGGTSTASNIPQVKTIENVSTVPVITMPSVSTNLVNTGVVNTGVVNTGVVNTGVTDNTGVINNTNLVNNGNNDNKDSSSSDDERGVVTNGRELNLEEIEAEIERSMESFVSSRKEKSLDSLTVQKMVSNIKKEFNVQQKNVDSSIDLDDLSFLNNAPKDKKQDDMSTKSSTVIGGTNVVNTNVIKPTVIKPTVINTNVINTNVSSIDMERLKEDGTILETTMVPNNNFLLNSITPTLKEKQTEVTRQKSPQIKKISIKYNVGMPLKKSNGVSKKKRLTLINEAADSDSSEMIFR
jgi:hypothetical protein